MGLPSNNKCTRLPVVCSRPALDPGHRASSPPYSAVARFATESLGGELLVTALNSVPHASHISSLAWSRISVTSPLRPRGLGGLAPAPAVAGELSTFPLFRAAAVSPCHAGIAWPRTHLAVTCVGPVERSLPGSPTLGGSCGDNSAPKRYNTSGRSNKNVPCEVL